MILHETYDEISVELERSLDLSQFHELHSGMRLINATRPEDKAWNALTREFARVAAKGNAAEGSIQPHRVEQRTGKFRRR